MNEISMRPDGLFFLERIVRSCVPTPTNGGMAGREYLLGLVKKGEEIGFDDFKNGFPSTVSRPEGSYDVYDHIRRVAEEGGVTGIGADFILDFFSGEHHIARAATDIREEKIAEIIGKKYAVMDYVSHVLLPVEITEAGRGFFSARYGNGDRSFPIRNLVAFPEETEKIRPGDFVLVHYASIVFSGIGSDTVSGMLDAQARNGEFMDACRSVSGSGIDHSKMLHFPWAKRLVKECGT